MHYMYFDTYFGRIIRPSSGRLTKACVGLFDDGHIRQSKHAVAKYNGYIIVIVWCYSDPTISIDLIKTTE
jgi:hypothetical protein